jgi:uncharacterized membrane protein (DUF485 family)
MKNYIFLPILNLTVAFACFLCYAVTGDTTFGIFMAINLIAFWIFLESQD